MSSLLTRTVETNPLMGCKVNVDGTMNVLEAARLANIKRVVYTSSKAVYGKLKGVHAHPTYKPIDEEYPKAPRTVYGATKLCMENIGLSYNRMYALDFVGLRLATTYGPGKLARHGFSIQSRIIESAVLGKRLKVAQGGEQLDDMVYHKDVANGIVSACFVKNLEHRVFHLGTGRGETLQHLADVVNNMFKAALIEVGPGLGNDGLATYCILNIDRARQELGYNPQYDLEKGVKDYIETMERLGITPSELS